MKPALAFVAAAPTASQALPPLAAPPLRTGPAGVNGAARRHVLALGIVVLHLLGLWGLTQMPQMRRTVAEVAPLVVRLVAPAEPSKPVPPPSDAMPKIQTPATTLIDAPAIAIAVAPAAATPIVATLPPAPPTAAPVHAAPTPVIPVAPPAPALKQVPASAVRYLREPRMSVPLMSRRLKESGVVHLRVVVDAQGQPREITLAKSSGFARLDEQALQDMRSARFVPQTENGQPIECEVIAPMSYEIDR